MHPAGLLQPIVSLSLGCTAILLLGGRTRDEAPTAMYVRHGDIVVFTGVITILNAVQRTWMCICQCTVPIEFALAASLCSHHVDERAGVQMAY